MGNYDLALRYYNRALILQDKIGDRKGQGISLNNIGSVYDYRGDYGQALQYYLKSLKMREEIGYREGQGVSMNNIGFIYYKLGDYVKALEYYQASLRIQQEIGNSYAEGVSLNNIGKLYQRLSDNSKALEFFQRSLDIRRRIGYRHGEAISLNNIASVQLEQRDLTDARINVARAEKIARMLGDKELLLKTYVSMSELAIALAHAVKNPDLRKARKNAGSVLKLANELRSMSAMAEALLLQARIEGISGGTGKGGFRTVEKNFQRAINIFKSTGENYELGAACYYYANFLISHGKQRESGQYMDSARRIFTELGARDWIKKTERLSVNI
jgi:tetratricopeptide (TPR) repeat protein